jgi:hypothetical protein
MDGYWTINLLWKAICPLWWTTTPSKLRKRNKGQTIEESRAASKVLITKFGYFLSISQQAVSVTIILNSANGIFFPKTEGTKT